MKILLLGKGGNVGQELQRTLLPLGNLTSLCRYDADFEDPIGLRKVLSDYAPDIIVNAAAYTAVDQAETHFESAQKINCDAVDLLASYAKQHSSLLVHYSTDYVFDGMKADPYTESDKPRPLSVYGRTKLAGELAVLDSGCEAIVLRTSWVYSSHGKNFIKTILKLAKERDELRIVADQCGAPTSAELIADVTALAISGYQNGSLPGGLYHLAAKGEATWHTLACHIVRRAISNGVLLRTTVDQIHPISANEYPAAAQRPKNSRLNADALTIALRLQLPNWEIHANRAIDQLTLVEAPE